MAINSDMGGMNFGVADPEWEPAPAQQPIPEVTIAANRLSPLQQSGAPVVSGPGTHIATAGAPSQVSPELAQMQARLAELRGQSESILPELSRRYGAIQQNYGEMQGGSAALKQLLLDTSNRIKAMQMGPSQTGMLSSVLGAVASARPGSGFGGAAGAGALMGQQVGEQGRNAELMKQELMLKYGIEANQADQMARQYGIQAAQAGLQPLMQRYNAQQSAMDRLVTQEATEANRERNAPVININGQDVTNPAAVAAKEAQSAAAQRGKNTANNIALTPDVIDTEAHLAIANGGKIDYAFARGNPMAAPAVVARMAEIEHEKGNDAQGIIYEGQANRARQVAANNWNSPSPNGAGSQVKNFGVVLNHFNVLERYLTALNNPATVPATLTRLKLAAQKELGQSTLPATVDALSPIVANEVTKAIIARGGTGAERQEAEQNLARNLSYGNQMAIIEAEKKLLAGQLGGMRTQYQASGMENVLGPFRGRLDAKILRDPVIAASIGEQPETGPVHVHSPEEAALYEPGTPLILPDGTQAFAK